MSNRAGGPYDTIALLGARNREHILLAVIDLDLPEDVWVCLVPYLLDVNV